ncbi:MAG: cytochrome P450 [Simkaniaceae bacterium]|nr:cytochrome P450 [Simkaniaceae bacterium]
MDALRSLSASMALAWHYGAPTTYEEPAEWRDEKYRLAPLQEVPRPALSLWQRAKAVGKVGFDALRDTIFGNPITGHDDRYPSLHTQRPWGQTVITITDPAMMAPILRHPRNDLPFGPSPIGAGLTQVVGPNLLSVSGEEHKKMAPAIFKKLTTIDSTALRRVQNHIDETLQRWSSSETPVNLAKEMPRLLVNAITLAIFGIEVPPESIDQIRESSPKREEALQHIAHLLHSVDSSVSINAIKALLIVARDTTTTPLLSAINEIQEKDQLSLRKVLGDNPLNCEVIDSILREAIRIAPPSTSQARITRHPCAIVGADGRLVKLLPARAIILCNHQIGQQDIRRWPRFPKHFLHLRFWSQTTEIAKSSRRMLPFSYGASRCMGKKLAELTFKKIFHTLLRNYSWEIVMPLVRHITPVSLRYMFGPTIKLKAVSSS